MSEDRVNVLMVDDRQENLLALEAILDGMGLNLERAHSGEEALKAVLRLDFALILMDVQMPGMNGFETAMLIKEREKSRHIPIMFLTAINKEERYVFEGYSVGAVDYMFKPFEPDILRSKVAVFVDLHRKNEQIRHQAELLRQADARERALEMAAVTAANELRYRNLADAMPVIVCTAGPDGDFTYFNQRWWDYTGLEPGTIIDRESLATVIHPDDVGVFFGKQAEALTSREGSSAEVRLRRAEDGAYHWHLIQACPEFDADGELMAWIGTFTDIHDRIQHQEALEKHNKVIEAEVAQRTRELGSQKRLMERLVDNAPAGIAYVDGDLVLRSANPEFARFADGEIRSLVDRPAAEAFARDAALFLPIFDAVRTSGEPHRMIGFPFGREGDPEHRRTFWDVIVFPVQDESGPPGVLVFALDVTDRVENERLQREQIDHLQQVDTLKDEFLSVISHELRTPLNFIMGFASILDDEVAGQLTPDQHAYLEKILKGTDRMLLLVNDLLDFAKIQAGEFELVAKPALYAPLVDEVVATLRPLADQKRISLSPEVPADLVANCDPERVIQVLTNLVGNAIKFTPEDGVVTIGARACDDLIVTEIEDTGIGIANEDMTKLFTRFRQLDMSRTRTAGGTGLGLSISKALVEAHGGAIEATSAGLGKGSCFRFTLHAADPALLGAAIGEDEATPGPSATRTQGAA
jgi:PAS domain S-box-containing protein